MIKAFYITLFVLSVVLLLILITFFKKHISTYFGLMFSFVVMQNLGYMQLVSAQNLQAALYTNQICYLAGCFIPFFSLMCIADICRTEIPRGIQIGSIISGIIIFCCISTIGTNDIYYSDVNIVVTEDCSYLEKSYGGLHILYPVYLVAMVVCALVIVIITLRRRKMVSYINCIVLLFALSQLVATYIVEKAVGVPIEFMPLSYVVMEIIVLILLRRISLHDISGISGETMANNMNVGFVMFSEDGKFTGADHAARVWFSELDELMIDHVPNNVDSPLLTQIRKWIKGDLTESVVFEQGDYVVEAKYDYISKRFSSAIHFITLHDVTKKQKYMRLIENFNERLELQVNEKTERIKEIQNDIIISMASIVENRDNNTGGHIARTSDIVDIFIDHLIKTGKYRELTPEIAECIKKSAALHDFGKIAIPDSILNKPGKFTDEEYEQMKKHSEKGAVIVARILQNSDDILFRNIAVNVAHYHHEKWNGTGYPTKLKGTEIPFEARVMALADVFDALVSKRVYKDSFDYNKAFSIIEESCGQHFDPDLCDEFLTLRSELEALYNAYTD